MSDADNARLIALKTLQRMKERHLSFSAAFNAVFGETSIDSERRLGVRIAVQNLLRAWGQEKRKATPRPLSFRTGRRAS